MEWVLVGAHHFLSSRRRGGILMVQWDGALAVENLLDGFDIVGIWFTELVADDWLSSLWVDKFVKWVVNCDGHWNTIKGSNGIIVGTQKMAVEPGDVW